MENKSLWKIILYASLGTIALFILVMYGLKEVSPVKATNVSYGAAAEVGGDCFGCHKKSTPGVTEEYAHSKHVTRGVKCIDCHNANIANAEVVNHYGTKIVAKPTPKNCASCHRAEHSQFEASNHAARSWYAVTGAEDFSTDQLVKFNLVDQDGKPVNEGKPNPVATYEGKEAMTLGCIKCHEIGKVQSDGSIGDCSKCHLGHEYSVGQVRKPETCSQCHMGPDHPQKEIYEESPHGVIYADSGSKWNWNAASGTLTVKDMPAPTCATCHMSAFGGAPGTHNVGDRLSWNLTPADATKRDEWKNKRANMTSVCVNCHSDSFIEKHYKDADQLVDIVDKNVADGQKIVDELKIEGLLTKKPFDESVEFKMFELWHHEGRRARFGGMMGGPDFVQWHGVYEQKKDLVELDEMAKVLRQENTLEKAIKGGQ